MKNNIKPKQRPFPSIHLDKFISSFKRNVKEKARFRQYLTGKQYTKCKESVCVDKGFASQHEFNKALEALSAQSVSNSQNEHRASALFCEQFLPGSKYFLMKGHLELLIDKEDILNSHAIVHGVYLDGKCWPLDKSLYPETLPQASPVDSPAESLNSLRMAGQREIYILNKQLHLDLWLDGWGGIAYVEEKLAKVSSLLSCWLDLNKTIK
ncbi:hypothetical protein FLL45_19800 [Aliikangiella marina]|uniref:Uncharacterized protein n=1 Tax=Aliikangiella marina TaxID=1712262 RepID=A0A545T2G4_9GAMM|nr:hypothetical protein [Aliikangiella marina]TQV71402.1 hypothetical protein FLL45_19800 [Aliikangiella marina]